ncbi:MAG TPA: TonB-dependent receptor [Polyangiaceae bacterium]|nr:TonB-dependent receptor [Polyangiaceae bacterium]
MPFRVSRIPAIGALLASLFGSQFGLAQAHAVVLPEVIERFDAEYPAATTAQAPVAVVLFVSLDVHGHVIGSEVAQSGGAPFDEAARAAVAHWRFTPALRDGKPVAVRIRVPFTFPARAKAASPEPPPSPPFDATNASANSDHGASTGNRAVSTDVPASADPSQTSALRDEAGHFPWSEKAQLDATRSGSEASVSAAVRTQASVRPSAPDATEVIVQGHYRAPTRGAGDFHIDVGQLALVPRKNATEMLQLAPGILLTNEGGEGHAHQVFLRGFDAREGQDIEFSVGGVPINEAGNLHGNGHADANFIIPEAVLSLRVLEGPFDPRQGNFGVAGSADYRLGIERRGLTVKSTLGSYGTQRILGLWGPPGLTRCSFGAVEIYKTDGFGQNRDAQRASAMAQYEGKFGETGSYRVTSQAYSANYHSAGVLRDDDYRAGRIGFFDTYDPRQGGDSSRYSIAADLEQSIRDTLFRQQLYVIRRDLRMRKNYTGFLLDVQEPAQNPHDQRGDGIDLSVDSWTLGSRGSSRVREKVGGLTQELELGYSARGDFGHGTQLRVQASNAVPYHRDVDVEYALGDIGIYADANLRFLHWLTVRGGIRGNFFSYNVLDRCAQQEVRQPSRTNPPGDRSCLDTQDLGYYRDPTQRSSTATTTLLPRASVILTPTTGLMLSMSYGQGVRSMDPIYISQDIKTPFARVDAYEAGIAYSRTLASTQIVARAAAFRTHVERDLIFSETAGRNTLANGTTRNGILAALRWNGTFFDQSLNATLVQSRFDDTGYVVPYVPNLVLRSDTATHHELPFKFAGSPVQVAAAAGVTFVGRRPLPYNQQSDTLFSIDASAELEWRRFALGLEITNLLDRRYRLGEYNYASDFHSAEQPTLVPVRHFTAGPPRMFFLTFAVRFGELS